MPTRSTIPPRISGSTLLESSIVRPVCSPIRLADARDGLLVERDRARDLDREQLVLLLPQLLEPGADPEDHRHPVALDQRLEEVHERRLGALDRAVQRVLLLIAGEVGGEEELRQVAALVQRVGELPELLVDRVEDVMVLRDLEQRARVDLGDLLPLGLLHPELVLRGPRRQRAEVELAERLLDQPRWSSSVSTLRVTRSVAITVRSATSRADLLDRAARLGLDVAAGLLHQLLAPRLGVLLGLALVRLAGLAGALDDLLGLLRAPRPAARGTRRAARRPRGGLPRRRRSTPRSPAAGGRAPRRYAGTRAS